MGDQAASSLSGDALLLAGLARLVSKLAIRKTSSASIPLLHHGKWVEIMTA